MTRRSPSIKNLIATLQLSPEQAKATKALLVRGPEVILWEHESHAIAQWLERVQAAAGGAANGFCGVESLYPEKPGAWYLNTGDTYSPTILFNADTWSARVGCWGDFVGA